MTGLKMSLPAKTSEQSGALSRFFFAKETPFGLALVLGSMV